MMFTHDGLLIWILKTMPYGFAEHICLLHLSMRTCFSWKVHHKIQLLLNVQYFNLIVLWFQWGNNCSALVCSNLSLLHVIQRHVLCWSGARRGPEENIEGMWRIHSDHLSEPGQQRAGVLWKVRGNSNRWREVDSFDVKSDDLKLFVICYLSSECSIYR